MNVQETIQEFIKTSSKKEVYRYLTIAASVITAFLLILFFLHIRSVHRLQDAMQKINRERRITRKILSKHERVQQQRQEVDAIIEQDKTFKIKEFFTRTVNDLGLSSNNTKPAEVSNPDDLGNGYTEIKLDASFTNISMRQLCNLLYTLEKSPRLYTKELAITKVPNQQKIDVTLVVATLQPKEL